MLSMLQRPIWPDLPVAFILCLLVSPLSSQGKVRKTVHYVPDYALIFGIVGGVTGVGSLVMSMLADRRAIRDEARLSRTEQRASADDEVRRRAARYLVACERAAGDAIAVHDRSHPEWRELSVGLTEGHSDENDVRVVYYKASYQSNPRTIGESSFASTWYKWYIGVSEWTEDLDVFAMFGELPHLLRRPGNLQFSLDQGVPEWVREQMPDRRIVGFLYNESIKF